MQRKRAIKAAVAIWDNLSDRFGFGLGCLKYDDREIYSEIIARIADIIQERDTELELASELLCHVVERWCNCDADEISNARHKLQSLLTKEQVDAK
jgi:hypothetical protein